MFKNFSRLLLVFVPIDTHAAQSAFEQSILAPAISSYDRSCELATEKPIPFRIPGIVWRGMDTKVMLDSTLKKSQASDGISIDSTRSHELIVQVVSNSGMFLNDTIDIVIGTQFLHENDREELFAKFRDPDVFANKSQDEGAPRVARKSFEPRVLERKSIQNGNQTIYSRKIRYVAKDSGPEPFRMELDLAELLGQFSFSVVEIISSTPQDSPSLGYRKIKRIGLEMHRPNSREDETGRSPVHP